MKNFKKKLLFFIILALIGGPLLGFAIMSSVTYLMAQMRGETTAFFNLSQFLNVDTYICGFGAFIVFIALYAINNIDEIGRTKSFGKPGTGDVESVLENSRFMTDKERDKNFAPFTFESAAGVKNDGVPVRAILDKKGRLQCNFMSGAHSLVIGATGSGKTTTFINPMIQLLAAAEKGSSMIMTDPKGELFDLHSGLLKEKGYDVKILDLRDTYSSSRWNPLGSIYDMYQDYLKEGKGLKAHKDSVSGYPDLVLADGEPEAGSVWVEYRGKAYADLQHCMDEVTVARQKIFDEMYEDLNDFVSVLCPITNEKDPLWEKGARSIITAVCLAMLEDSADPALGMTKEKFNFFNVNKMGSIIFFVGLTLPRYRFSMPYASLDMNLRQCIG